MSLSEKLFADMKDAMKQREAGKLRLATIRMVRAAQQEAEVAKRGELTEEELLHIISREIKKRSDAIPDYERANRLEQVQQLRQEIEFLKDYLPEQLGESELRAMISQAIRATGAASPQDMGKVMKALMPELKGRADGKTVNLLVKEMLQ